MYYPVFPGEMDKAYAVLAGSDKIDQPTTQVDNKTDVTSKPNPRANAAVNSFFKKTLAPGLDASEEKAAQDVSQGPRQCMSFAACVCLTVDMQSMLST